MQKVFFTLFFFFSFLSLMHAQNGAIVSINKSALDGSDSQLVVSGGTASFEITVTNTGFVDLVDVIVADALSPACDNFIGNLAVGQSVTYTCSVSNVMSNFTNIATVTANSATAGSANPASDETEVVICTAPVLSCPNDLVIQECTSAADSAILVQAFLDAFTFSGGCNASEAFDPAFTVAAMCEGGQTVVTYVVTDDNGTDNCIRNIFVNADMTDPVFTTACPADISVECDQPVPTAATLEATDNCQATPAPAIFINEIHYDNAGGDIAEGIEVAGSAGLDLTGYSIVLYNGANSSTYNTEVLSGVIDDEGTGFGAVNFLISGIQNGAPDGVALVDPAGNVIEFLNYEGATITATNGPANGMTSINIGVSESSSTPVGESLQRTGMGGFGSDFTWNAPSANSAGDLNVGQTVSVPPPPPIAVVFEESFVAGCGITGVITRTWTATDACGNEEVCTQLVTIQDTTDPTFVGTLPADVTIECDESAPAPEMLMAMDNCPSASTMVIFINEIHYDNTGGDVGEFFEIAGSAGLDLSGYQVALYNGSNAGVYNTINLAGVIPDEGTGFGAIDFQLSANGLQNGSPDGLALVDPGGMVIEFLSYEGTITATGGAAMGLTSTDIGVSEPGTTPIGESLQRTGMGGMGSDFTWGGPLTETPGLLNVGQTVMADLAPIAVTLSENFVAGACGSTGVLTRTYTAIDACGNDVEHLQTITIEDNTPPSFLGTLPADVMVECDAIPAAATLFAVDNCGAGLMVWINESHYDNTGGDVGEFVEVAGFAGIDLTAYTLVLYNGSNGLSYNTTTLSGVIPDEGNGFGAVSFSISGIQNGSPDGIALAQGISAIQFISYEGSFVAMNGPAGGMTSMDIGVSEPSGTPVGQSLQLIGTGSTYTDFTWTDPVAESPGLLNVGQTTEGNITPIFMESTVDGGCAGESTITRTWTATDACDNPMIHVQTITVEDNTAPAPVCQNITVSLDADGNATITPDQIDNGSSDLCGTITLSLSQTDFSCSNIGDNTVTLTVTDACGNAASCTATVTIVDDLPPVMTCPSDQTIHLDPGACDQVLSYDVSATDNCPLLGPLVSLTTNNDLNAPITNSVGCPGGGYQTLLAYDLPAMGVTTDLFIESIDFGIFQIFGNVDLTVNVYSIPSTPGAIFNYADLTLLGTGTQNFGAQGNGFGNIPVTGTIPAGTVVVLELVAPNGTFTNGFVPGYNNQGLMSGVSYLASDFCGVPNPQDVGQVLGGFTDVAAMQLNANAPLEPTQTAGLPSGSAFPIGTTTNTWEITDGSGNTSSCTWSITVVEFVPTSNNITCNNLVNISLDENCSATVGADQILEGNNYGCYDNYDVVFANSGLPLILDGSHVGQTIEVMVTNPNGNPCWGSIFVEDKLIPELDCQDFEVTCADPTAPGSSFDARVDYAFPQLTSQDNNTVTETVVVGEGGAIQDLDVAIFSTHTWVGDLVVSITSPAGTTVELFNNLGGPGLGCNNAAGQNLDVVMNDAAASTYADMNGQCPPVGEFQPSQALAAFNGENAQGTWTISVQDLVGGDGGTVDVTLDLKSVGSGSVDFPVGPDVIVNPAGPNTWTLLNFDPCGPATLVYTDVESGELCDADKTITREWVVTDESGNTTSCTQTISVTPITIADLTLPADVTVECGDDTSVSNTGGLNTLCENIGAASSDNIIEICEGSYKILRTWTIADWCTNEIVEHLQIIKVLDTQGPSIAAIADIAGGMSSNDCLGGIQLPTPSVTDCGTASAGIVYEYAASQGDIIGNNLVNLPLGPTTLTITATDDCGNGTSVDVTVTITDDFAPIAICDEFTIVGLGSDGTASVNAMTFDDGSYDNCEIVEYSVRRTDNGPDCNFDYFPPFGNDNAQFNEVVHFCCSDLGSTIMVELRVKDAAGNTNSCMVEVEVQDKINPTIICPPNLVLECDEDYTDLALTGEAIGNDNCSATVTYFDQGGVNDCGEGTIFRVWTATDQGGRTASCVQRIDIVNTSPFFINAANDNDPTDDVVWPLDYEATTCGTGLEPSDLSSPYNYPVVDEGACNNVAIGHEDQVLDFGAADACLKILRTWYVVDWCQADENQDPTQPGPGVWHYTQIIKVINSTAPTISCEPDNGINTIPNFNENCEATFVQLKAIAQDDCTPANLLEFTWALSDGQTGTGNDASQDFENGDYSITFTVTDLCGNATDCSRSFSVVDAKKPTPVCIFGIATTVMPSSGSVTIWASDFESGSSYDNCTAYDDLQFSFSQDVTLDNITINCNDIPADGLVPVSIYVTDEAGNFDFCLTFIQVQDPNGACANPTAIISGKIENEVQEDIEDVTVTLSDPLAVYPNPVVTGSDGEYAYSGVSLTLDYNVSPEKDINYLNGVTTFDLVLISKHILGTDILDSPYKVFAADANNSQSVTTLDIVKLRALILHIDDELANNTSWRFVDANHIFTNPINPWETIIPEEVNLIGDGSLFDPANFTAVKVGDVNGTASPNSLLGSDTRTFDGTLSLQVEAAKVEAGEIFTVDFRAKDFANISGYQFTLGFDQSAIEFVDLATNLENLGTNNFGLTKLAEGVITTSWNNSKGISVDDGAILFSMTFVANNTITTNEIFEINSRYTVSEAYANDNLYDVILDFNSGEVANEFELYQNTPNPFKVETTIGFSLPEGGAVTLKIYDVSGRVLKLIEVEAVKGFNSVNVNRAGIDATGVLYYQLETATETATKKMILID